MSSLCASADFAVVWSFLTTFRDTCAPDWLAAGDATIPRLGDDLEATHEVPERLKDLYCRLLRRAVRNFRPNNWERSLFKFCHEAGLGRELERCGVRKASPALKLKLLKLLLEHQFVSNAKFKSAVNKADNASLRLSPLGSDERGRRYWLQRDSRANLRLYVEDQDEETWRLVASDRAGLTETIAALKAGKCPFEPPTEPASNEDSNSVGSPSQIDGDDDVKKDVVPERPDSVFEDDSDTKAGIEDTSAVRGDSEKPSSENEKISSHSDKEKSDAVPSESEPPTKYIESDDEAVVGEEIQEKVMIVKGDGNGADCDSPPVHFFSQEIEEDVMYVFGEGSGFDCMTGNPRNDPGSTATQQNSIQLNANSSENNGAGESSQVLKSNSVVNSETEDVDRRDTNDSIHKSSPSAPLPVSKRILQNIPKSPSEGDADASETSRIPDPTIESPVENANSGDNLNNAVLCKDSLNSDNVNLETVTKNDPDYLIRDCDKLTNTHPDVTELANDTNISQGSASEDSRPRPTGDSLLNNSENIRDSPSEISAKNDLGNSDVDGKESITKCPVEFFLGTSDQVDCRISNKCSDYNIVHDAVECLSNKPFDGLTDVNVNDSVSKEAEHIITEKLSDDDFLSSKNSTYQNLESAPNVTEGDVLNLTESLDGSVGCKKINEDICQPSDGSIDTSEPTLINAENEEIKTDQSESAQQSQTVDLQQPASGIPSGAEQNIPSEEIESIESLSSDDLSRKQSVDDTSEVSTNVHSDGIEDSTVQPDENSNSFKSPVDPSIPEENANVLPESQEKLKPIESDVKSVECDVTKDLLESVSEEKVMNVESFNVESSLQEDSSCTLEPKDDLECLSNKNYHLTSSKENLPQDELNNENDESKDKEVSLSIASEESTSNVESKSPSSENTVEETIDFKSKILSEDAVSHISETENLQPSSVESKDSSDNLKEIVPITSENLPLEDEISQIPEPDDLQPSNVESKDTSDNLKECVSPTSEDFTPKEEISKITEPEDLKSSNVESKNSSDYPKEIESPTSEDLSPKEEISQIPEPDDSQSTIVENKDLTKDTAVLDIKESDSTEDKTSPVPEPDDLLSSDDKIESSIDNIKDVSPVTENEAEEVADISDQTPIIQESEPSNIENRDSSDRVEENILPTSEEPVDDKTENTEPSKEDISHSQEVVKTQSELGEVSKDSEEVVDVSIENEDSKLPEDIDSEPIEDDKVADEIVGEPKTDSVVETSEESNSCKDTQVRNKNDEDINNSVEDSEERSNVDVIKECNKEDAISDKASNVESKLDFKDDTNTSVITNFDTKSFSSETPNEQEEDEDLETELKYCGNVIKQTFFRETKSPGKHKAVENAGLSNLNEIDESESIAAKKIKLEQKMLTNEDEEESLNLKVSSQSSESSDVNLLAESSEKSIVSDIVKPTSEKCIILPLENTSVDKVLNLEADVEQKNLASVSTEDCIVSKIPEEKEIFQESNKSEVCVANVTAIYKETATDNEIKVHDVNIIDTKSTEVSDTIQLCDSKVSVIGTEEVSLKVADVSDVKITDDKKGSDGECVVSEIKTEEKTDDVSKKLTVDDSIASPVENENVEAVSDSNDEEKIQTETATEEPPKSGVKDANVRVTRKSSRLDRSSENATEKVNVEVSETKQGVRTRRADASKETKVPSSTKDSAEVNATPKSSKRPVQKEESNDTNKTKLNRKRGRDESESVSEVENQETAQSKKIKMKQKKPNSQMRKKVEAKLQKNAENLSSDEEAETLKEIKPRGRKPGKNKTIVASTPIPPKKKATKSKVEAVESPALEPPADDPPIRQSRRIAQLKIKEEAQRRLMEEMALKELKAQHKKKIGKTKDKDWQKSQSEHSSDEVVEKKGRGKHKKVEDWKKKAIGWHSSSGGNETDTEPGEEPEDDFDDPDVDEDDLLASKSDHEFSPESDVEGEETIPVRRARTLKKEDADDDEDVDGGCTHCGKSDHPEWILLCDTCDAGWHASCLKPVLFLVPEGKWYCPPCNHKALIEALEIALDEHDKQVELVKVEDLKRKKSVSNQSLDKEKDSDDDEFDDKSDDSDKTSSESCSSDSSSSDGERIYRLRERRQLPISYRFKEYDQLISSAIKEEYKEVDNSGAGNQGRGKDISTIIEADREEKMALLQAELQASGKVMESEESVVTKKRVSAPRPRRRPRKLNSLEDLSDDFDDNSDEDFKETGWSTSSSEAISSANTDKSSGSSSSSDSSLPLKRSLRNAGKSKGKKSKVSSPIRKKRARRILDDTTSESDEPKDESQIKKVKKEKAEGDEAPPKKSKKRKKEKHEDGAGSNSEKPKGRAKIKYGGLSDSSKSSHDWSPAHRTRQRKYNYMELPNTESEDEAHKPSGKHMDSSDEYKGESDSGSESDSSREKKTNTEVSPTKEDDAKDNSTVTPTKRGSKSKRGARSARSGGSAKKKSAQGDASVPGGQPDGTNTGDPNSAENCKAEMPVKALTPLQIEREKKRKQKLEEKEKRKEERLKKKEEKLQLKEQKAKEREEKRNIRMGNIDSGIPISPNLYNVSTPIPIRHAGDYPRIMQPVNPAYASQPPMVIRSPMPQFPTPIRASQPNIGQHILPPGPPRAILKEGIPIDDRDPSYRYPPPPIEHPPIPPLKSEVIEGEDRPVPFTKIDEPKRVPMPMDGRQMFRPVGPHGPFQIHRGMSPTMDGAGIPLRPFPPGYAYEGREMPIIRGDALIRPPVKPPGELIPNNGVPVTNPVPGEPKAAPIMPKNEMSPNNPHLSDHESVTPKRRGRGLGKKTIARQAAAAAALGSPNPEGGSPNPSNSPSLEGPLTVAGAPQPFRPTVDPPSVITRMPHIMPPPYRGSPPYGGPVFSPRPLLSQPPTDVPYRARGPHSLDPSPSGGGPVQIATPERSSPQNPYSPYQSPYYSPAGTPPQLGPYPPPHGRFPPHMTIPSFRSPAPRAPSETVDVEEKPKPPRERAEPVPPIEPDIKQEPPTVKRPSSPSDDAAESPSEGKSDEPEERPANFSSASSGPAAKPAHPRLKHTDNKPPRGRVAMTSVSRFSQGPYAPHYPPYAPYQTPAGEAAYMNSPLRPNEPPPPQLLSQMHRPGYPLHHPGLHVPPMQLHPRLHHALERGDDGAEHHPPEGGEFGGLVSYFSSQREDDMDS